MSDGTASTEQHDHEGATLTRRPWIRPAVTKMDAADAEVGTRPTGPDGAFSVS
jgi:hypothetical protein